MQCIEGRVTDPEAVRRRLEDWHERLAPTATGWLGTTAGVTADGTAFTAVRFVSAEDARANSDRPEQSEWWAETQQLFDGEPSFLDVDDVEVMRAGGSDDAGFVQVIRGRVKDTTAALSLIRQGMEDDARPDVIGGIAGVHPDGEFAMVVYFTSEAEAREGEATEAAEGEDFAEQMAAVQDGPPRYLDLTDPWFWSH